ncbi:MAG: lipid-binding SYLF domain-containing protein [Enterobacterales bacterium]|jgi:lipid-binding SYLF domain-containing protein
MNKITIVTIFILMFLQGCSAPGSSGQEKRAAIESMRQNVLADIYKLKPELRARVNSAPGYAVFSNVNINIIFFSAGSGYGQVINNATGRKTYMKMGEAGLGFGAGAKDFRALFIFKSKAAMDRFVNIGWTFAAQADAAAKAGDKGAAIAAEAIADDIRVYQLTENGLALQATIKGTKYWKDDSLN